MDNNSKQLLENWEKEFHEIFSKGLEDGIGKVRWSRTLEVKDFIKKLLAVQEAKTREEERHRACNIIQKIINADLDNGFRPQKSLEEAQQQILDLNNK